MPLYDYRCKECGKVFEKRTQGTFRYPDCPECDGVAERLPSAPAIQFKGAGWTPKHYGEK